MSTELSARTAARLDMPEAELLHLLARVNAAALPDGDDRWIELIAPGAGAEIRDDLARLRRTVPAANAQWHGDRLASVRAVLAEQGVCGLIVPQADPHMGEYIPARHQRLAWLTGFTGSAGLAIVHRDTVALFVDGRYTLQAAREVDARLIEARHHLKPAPMAWLGERLATGERIGYDPRLVSVRQADEWRKTIASKGGELVALDHNPVDACWSDQPPEPLSPLTAHPLEFSGESLDDKCERLGKVLAADGLDATVLNQLDAIAWLFNIRGNDVANTPVSVSYGVLNADGSAALYVDTRKLDGTVTTHLGNRVAVHPITAIETALDDLGRRGARVGLAMDSAADWLRTRLTDAGAQVESIGDIIALPRARKNAVELEGARAAHRRDAVAITRLLKWLGETAPAGELTELDVVARLEQERKRIALHKGPSFDTIAGAGAHGAIVHYRVTGDTNARIVPGELLLVDSGGQYLDGTTDITRTVAVGQPPEGAREMFTLVLKGHIALARAHFPVGTTGAQLDSLARQYLWDRGVNFDHGTGHGVGSYLSVHEGPQRISATGHAKLEPGMILSNEPGHYAQDAYGIRIENLLVVTPSARAENFLEFETITLAPIDRALIDVAMLSSGERDWLDAYHQKVREVVGPQLEGSERDWLDQATGRL